VGDGWRPVFTFVKGWNVPAYGETVEWRDYGAGGKPFVATQSKALSLSVNLEWRPLRFKLIELGLYG
jgi:hypothetical protein